MKKYYGLLLSFVLLLIFVIAGCSNTKEEGSKTVKDETDDLTNSPASEDNRFIFTANEGGSISKISVEEQKLIETFEIDGAVHNIQVSPDGKIVGAVVVPNMSDGNGELMEMKGKAIFFNPETNEMVEEVEVGNHPAHIVFTEDGKYVLVTNNEDNTVSVIDAKDYSIIETISTGKGPHGFRISNDSKLAYVANMGEDSVSVIDLQSLKEKKKIQVGSAPATTGVTSDGNTLIATVNKDNTLAIIDLKSGEIDKVDVGNGPVQVYIEPDNQFAYVANQGTEDNPDHSVTKVDLKSKKVSATIDTGEGSHGIVTSADSKFTYVANMFEDTVSVIDNEQNKTIKTIKVGKKPNGITVMP